MKRCKICLIEYPNPNEQYYRRAKKNKDGLDNVCKKCRKENRKYREVHPRTTNFTNTTTFEFPKQYICQNCPKIQERPYNQNWKQDYNNKIIQSICLEILIEIPPNTIDLIITDPPYQDNQTCIHNIMPTTAETQEMARILKPGTALYSFTSLKKYPDFIKIYEPYLDIKTPLIWIKRALQQGNHDYDYASQVELILYATKGQHKLNCGKTGNIHDIGMTDNTYHPHQKPLELITQLIQNSSKEGDTILDPYAGSGTTLIAAKQQNRNYIGIEIDKKYHDAAITRLLQTIEPTISKTIKGIDTTNHPQPETQINEITQ
jgi:site-specific DNA-methyltransferase (adenine-specific)